MRRCVAIDLHDRSVPRPTDKDGDVQAFVVRGLFQSIVNDLESLRRLIRSVESCVEQGRTRQALSLIESADGLAVNCSIYAEDGAELGEEIAKTMRALKLGASEWPMPPTSRRIG